MKIPENKPNEMKQAILEYKGKANSLDYKHKHIQYKTREDIQQACENNRCFNFQGRFRLNWFTAIWIFVFPTTTIIAYLLSGKFFLFELDLVVLIIIIIYIIISIIAEIYTLKRSRENLLIIGSNGIHYRIKNVFFRDAPNLKEVEFSLNWNQIEKIDEVLVAESHIAPYNFDKLNDPKPEIKEKIEGVHSGLFYILDHSIKIKNRWNQIPEIMKEIDIHKGFWQINLRSQGKDLGSINLEQFRSKEFRKVEPKREFLISQAIEFYHKKEVKR